MDFPVIPKIVFLGILDDYVWLNTFEGKWLDYVDLNKQRGRKQRGRHSRYQNTQGKHEGRSK